MTDILIGDQIFAALLSFCDAPSEPIARRGPYQPKRDGVLDDVTAFVTSNPGTSPQAVAAAIGVPDRTAQTYLDRLHSRGVLRKEIGRPTRWYRL